MTSASSTLRNTPCDRGISLVEILIALAMSGILAALAVSVVLRKNDQAWPGITLDYTQHLARVYNKIKLENGNTPINAVDVNGTALYADGIASLLRSWETRVTYTARTGSVPGMLTYPSKMRVYLDPEDTNITDTSNQLPRHQASALTPDNPVIATSPKTIMANTDDREWLLLDINGTDAPNSLATNGDRVLLIVDDSTGRILTAWQKCKNDFSGTINGATNTTCTLATPAPSRVYYRSFFDVSEGY